MGIASTTIGDRSLITGSRDKWRCGFGTQAELDASFTTTLGGTDVVRYDGDSQGSRFTAMVRSSLSNAAVTVLKGRDNFASPTRIGFGLSLSQRISGEAFVVEAAAITDAGAIDGGEDGHLGEIYNLVNASATGATVTFKTTADTTLVHDDFVCLYDIHDTRLNAFGRITSVLDQRTYTLTAEVTIGTIALTATATGRVQKINLAGAATDSVGLLASGTNTSNAYYFTKSKDSPALVSPYTSFGSSWSVETVPTVQPYSTNKQPRYNTELLMSMDAVKFNFVPVDSPADVTVSYKRTQNLPSIDKQYAVRIKAISLPNAMPPLAIASVAKTGATTATVVTRTAHGLQTGAYVRTSGSCDQTNFPNLTADTVITVVNATTFTLVWGPAVTLTNYGGIVKPVHSGAITGILPVSARAWVWRNGLVWMGTSANPTLTVGDTVRLIGAANSGGTVTTDEGLYRVVVTNPVISSSDATTATSTALTVSDTTKFAPGQLITGSGISGNTFINTITNGTQMVLNTATTSSASGITLNMTGVVLEPINVTPKADGTRVDLRLTLGGGALIKETDLCLHYIRSLDHTRLPVEVISGHQTGDIALSVPVVVNSVRGSISANEGSFAAQSIHQLTSAAGTNATSAKTTAGTIYAMAVVNYGPTDAYVKVYNKASTPIVGTDMPRYVIKIPANSDRMVEFGRAGIRYGTGIALAITGGQAVTDTTAVVANQVTVDTSYA